MMPAPMEQLLPAGQCPPRWVGWTPTALVDNSREVIPGCLFVARPGPKADGRSFLRDAFASGARAALADLSDGFAPQASLRENIIEVRGLSQRLGQIAAAWSAVSYPPCVAVTGTDGKTTTSWYFAQLWDALQGPTGVVGTLGAGLWGRDIQPQPNTTPGVLQSHGLAARLRGQGARAIVLEATSIGLDQGRLDGLPIRAVAWTSFSADHLDYHGSRLRYFRSKRLLLQRAGVANAVLWTGGRPLAALAQRLREDGAVRVWSVREGRGQAEGSGAERSDVDALVQGHSRAGDGPDGREGWTARLHLPDGDSLEFGVASRARHDLHNMAVALLLVRAMGGDLRAAAKLSPQLLAPPGRMQEVRLQGGDAGLPRVWIDYSHTPAALESALSSLRGEAPLWCLMGCGGQRDAAKRPRMGQVAARLADQLWITDDNPRGEDPAAIRAQIAAGASGGAQVRDCGDRRGAIQAAIAQAPAGASILIAGKGHEGHQEMGAERLPFSDADEALAALRSRAGVRA